MFLVSNPYKEFRSYWFEFFFLFLFWKRMLHGASVTNIEDIFEGWSDYACNILTSNSLMTIVTQKNHTHITPSTLGADRFK